MTPLLTRGWTVAVAATVGLVVLASLPPIIGGEVGAVLHHAFSAVCHQLPERSAHLAGGSVALCHRCSGILLGLLAGLSLTPLVGADLRSRLASSRQGLWMVAAVVPTLVDWALGASGLWMNTPVSRMLTGALFGVVAGAVLATNLLAARSSSPSPSLADA